MLGRLKSACEENLVPYPCICPCILNPFICIRVVLGWKSQSAVNYKPVGSDLKLCLSSRVFLLKFGWADRRPVSCWPRPKHHITNRQVRSLCNLHFVSCYPVDYLRFFFNLLLMMKYYCMAFDTVYFFKVIFFLLILNFLLFLF